MVENQTDPYGGRESAGEAVTESVSDSRQHLADRTRFVFGVPSWPASVSASLVVAALTGIIGFGPTLAGVGTGVGVVGVPAILATALTAPAERVCGGEAFDTPRSGLLALSCCAVVAAFVVVDAIAWFIGIRAVSTVEVVLLASATVFAFRLLVLVAVSGPPLSRRLVPAGVQPGVSVVAAVAFAVGDPSVPAAALGVGLACAVLYSGIVVGLVGLVDRPLRREWGVSGFEFVHQFLEHVAGRPTDLESYFTRLGESVEIPTTVLSVRRPSGEEKARVVSTLAHAGPFAGVGGSTLPYRLAEGGAGLTFTTHGMAGHDYDPTSQAGVTAVCEAADRAVDAVTHDRRATPPVRRTGEPTLVGQAFGDGALIVSTFAPLATDDVEHGVGRAATTAARTAGIENPLLVDAHNSQPTADADGRTVVGSARAHALTDGVKRLAADLATNRRGRLQVGVAADPTPWDAAEGIGPLGIRALATEVDDTTGVLVLVDGNNMISGLRERVRQTVEADVVEVATTDSHEVNRLNSTNYVGIGVDSEEFAALAGSVGTAAVADLEPVVAGTATETAELTVFGEGTVDRLAGFADRILPVCGAFVAVSTVVVTAVGVVLFSMT